MVYHDDFVTVNVDEIIGLTRSKKKLILVFQNTTMSIDYPDDDFSYKAYEIISRKLGESRKLEQLNS